MHSSRRIRRNASLPPAKSFYGWFIKTKPLMWRREKQTLDIWIAPLTTLHIEVFSKVRLSDVLEEESLHEVTCGSFVVCQGQGSVSTCEAQRRRTGYYRQLKS